MSGNPHLFLLSKAMRQRSNPLHLAMRGGGGGHFHKPDPKVATPYEHKRVVHLEDINTVLYHDYSPEYHMHLHSPFIQNSKQGIALQIIYFLLILAPAWWLAQKTHRLAGSHLFPSLRPGKDHAHMGPRLVEHLKYTNYENKQDALGRRTGAFYKNYIRQVNDINYKPGVIEAIEHHGFKF